MSARGLKAAVKGLVLDEDAVCALKGVIFTSPLVGMPAAVCSRFGALPLALATLWRGCAPLWLLMELMLRDWVASLSPGSESAQGGSYC